MELLRNGLKLVVVQGLDDSEGSVNVPVKLGHNSDDQYVNFTEQVHIRYINGGKAFEEILPSKDSEFYIPGKVFVESGPIQLAVHLINGDVERVTNELQFVVKKAPNGKTLVDPSEFSWQQLVDQYVNAKLDTFADKADMNEFKGDVNANLTNQNSKITTLESRMDTFTSLKEGSTTGDAELTDVRVGADGTKYTSAGKAVREQVSKLKEDLYELYNLLTEDVLSVINENTPTTSLTGKLIDIEGNLVDFTTWKTMYFTATEDFKMYVDNFTNNYFRIGIFDGEIKSENLISLYMKNIDDGTNTLPTVDNKANVKTGNTVVFSMTSGTTSFKIFKVTRGLVYEPKKMYYSKSGNIFDIYVQSKTSDNFMHYVYKQDIDDSINLNTWRFYTYEIVDENFNRLYGCSQVTPSIEMDSVVKETDSVDFMGGYHGDENMTALSVLVDGKVIDMSEEIPLTKFYKEIRFCGTSIIDKCNTPNDNMFTRYKTNVFSLDGYYSKQRWVALQECNLQLAYMGMMSLPVADNGITMVTTARMDNNYIEQKFHENTVENGAKYPSKDVREVEIYGNKLYGKARFFTDNYDSAYRAFCDDSQNNNFKAYFRVGVGVSALHTGEELRGEMHVEFMY